MKSDADRRESAEEKRKPQSGAVEREEGKGTGKGSDREGGRTSSTCLPENIRHLHGGDRGPSERSRLANTAGIKGLKANTPSGRTLGNRSPPARQDPGEAPHGHSTRSRGKA